MSSLVQSDSKQSIALSQVEEDQQQQEDIEEEEDLNDPKLQEYMEHVSSKVVNDNGWR